MAALPECLILCRCLHAGDKEARIGAMECLSEEDWEAVIRESDRQGLTPLLWERVSRDDAHSRIPDRVLSRLRQSYFDAIRKNTLLYHQLSKILRTLSAAGISAIVLKGVHLAEVVYGNIGLRPMVDIDLLIREADLPEAIAALQKLDYLPDRQIHLEASCRVRKHLPRFWGPMGVSVELHNSICDPKAPFAIDTDGLWERKQPIRITDVQTFALAPEDLLLQVCFHAAYEHILDFGLRPLCDICEIVRCFRGSMDWDRFLVEIHNAGIARGSCLILLIAHELLGAEIPEAVRIVAAQIAGDPEIHYLTMELLLNKPERPGPMSADFARAFGNSFLAERIAILWRVLFRSPQEMLAYYSIPHPVLVPFWYFVRAKDLLLLWGAPIWRLLHHEETTMNSVNRRKTQNELYDWMSSSG
jgi:hypothetical protein